MFHSLGEVDQAALGERDPLVFEAELNYAAKRLGIVLIGSEKSENLIGIVVRVMRRPVKRLVVPNTFDVARTFDHIGIEFPAIERRISKGSR